MTGDTVPFPAPRAAAITTPTCLAQLVLGKPHPPGALWPCQAETGKGVAQGRQPHPAFLQTSEPRTKGRGCVQTKLDKNSPRPGTPGDRQYETLSVRSGPGHTGKPAGPGTGRHSLSGEGKPWAAGKALGTPPPRPQAREAQPRPLPERLLPSLLEVAPTRDPRSASAGVPSVEPFGSGRACLHSESHSSSSGTEQARADGHGAHG